MFSGSLQRSRDMYTHTAGAAETYTCQFSNCAYISTWNFLFSLVFIFSLGHQMKMVDFSSRAV